MVGCKRFCLAATAGSGMSAEEENALGDGIVGEFATYEDYLDSQISTTDIYYLEDEDLARQLVVCTCAPQLFLSTCDACRKRRGRNSSAKLAHLCLALVALRRNLDIVGVERP